MMSRHAKMDLYCPYCLKQLIEVIKTGHYFCPATVCCDYEKTDDGREPLTSSEVKDLSMIIHLDKTIGHIEPTLPTIENLLPERLQSLKSLIRVVTIERQNAYLKLTDNAKESLPHVRATSHSLHIQN